MICIFLISGFDQWTEFFLPQKHENIEYNYRKNIEFNTRVIVIILANIKHGSITYYFP